MNARTAVAALLVLPVGVACSASSGGGDDGSGTLTVLAAASLTEAFEDLAEDFEAQHPDVEVEFSFGSSTDLAGQAADGAPGDVLATADEESMQVAVESGVVDGEPRAFATNTLVLVTPQGNPGDVESLADLAGSDWVRCADEVPCGRLAKDLLGFNGVTAEPASLEEDVKSTLEKVASGEADAGLVYATDAISAGNAVETVVIPGAADWSTSYFLAPLDQADDSAVAREWAEYVLSSEGRASLSLSGFSTP